MLEERLRQREHTWLYVSPETHKLSKVKARVNPVGYLVTGYDIQTQIVCIKDETLTLSDHGCVDAVRFDDPRLRVLMPREYLAKRRERPERNRDIKGVKTLFAAHCFIFLSKDIHTIAKIVNVLPETLAAMIFSEDTDDWENALAFWGYTGDPIPDGALELRESATLKDAEERWVKLFETLQIEPVTDIDISFSVVDSSNSACHLRNQF